jgi:maleate cis-trans isomerase
MLGWRARIGVLVPPGNPTVEPEPYRMTPTGVSIHFARLDAGSNPGDPGGAAGMDDRTRAYLAGLAGPAQALAALSPAAVVLAHTASSYAGGFAGEPALIERLAAVARSPAVTTVGKAPRSVGSHRL